MEQFQQQKQMLSRSMIQSSEILQMDVQELGEFIQREALENPMIDLEEIEKGIARNRGGDEEPGRSTGSDDFCRKLEWLSRIDEQNRVYYTEEHAEAEEKGPWNFAADENDLHEYVMSQLLIHLKTPQDKRCMEFLVYNLDSRGYLSEDREELKAKLGINEADFEQYLHLLQSAEPAGVGAGNLTECLQIQIRRRLENGLYDEEETAVLAELAEHDMEAMGRRHFAQIADRLDLPVEEILRYYAMLQKLNPIPGNAFSAREKLSYIRPDVTVVRFEDHFEVLVNDVYLPQVSVSRSYLDMMRQDHSAEVRDYLQSKFKRVQWVQHCIQERTDTLLEVSKAIVRMQQDFFTRPGGTRVPMGLRDIAEDLDLHESTVSRAVKNKFLQCAWGIYPMSWFFTRKAASDESGESMTPEQVKNRIREIIEGEDPKKPLSDQKIANILKESGVEVSRRTVAKYRGELMIPDTTGRKYQSKES